MIPVCPRCDTQLFVLDFESIELDFCHGCRGVWLDDGELETIAVLAGASADDPLLSVRDQAGTMAAGRKFLCPRCDSAMPQVVFQVSPEAAVTVERCPRGHGLWFEQGELRELLNSLATGGKAASTTARLNEVFFVTKNKD